VVEELEEGALPVGLGAISPKGERGSSIPCNRCCQALYRAHGKRTSAFATGRRFVAAAARESGKCLELGMELPLTAKEADGSCRSLTTMGGCMRSMTGLRISAAKVDVPGSDGVTHDATLVRDHVFGVAGSRRRAGRVATEVLEDISLALGPLPSVLDLQRAFEHVVTGLPMTRWPGRTDLAGAAIAVALPRRLLLAQVGSALTYLVSDGVAELLTGWWERGLDARDLVPELGDRLVLCTEGLRPLLDREVLTSLACLGPEEACARLQELAVLGAVEDTAAVVLVVERSEAGVDPTFIHGQYIPPPVR
jgi:hypothetical protein